MLLCRLRQDHGFDERRVASVFIFFCYEREFIYAHRYRGWGGGRTAFHTFSERGRIPQNYFNFPHTHISGVIILCNKKCSWSLIQIFFRFRTSVYIFPVCFMIPSGVHVLHCELSSLGSTRVIVAPHGFFSRTIYYRLSRFHGKCRCPTIVVIFVGLLTYCMS